MPQQSPKLPNELTISEWLGNIKKNNEGVTFSKPIGYVGGGMYRISDQCLGDKAAWDSFCDELQKQGLAVLEEMKNKSK